MFNLKYHVFKPWSYKVIIRIYPFKTRCPKSHFSSLQINPSLVGVGVCHDVFNFDMWPNLELYKKCVQFESVAGIIYWLPCLIADPGFGVNIMHIVIGARRTHVKLIEHIA